MVLCFHTGKVRHGHWANSIVYLVKYTTIITICKFYKLPEELLSVIDHDDINQAIIMG